MSLKQFVISRQKSLSTRITAEMANIKASVREKQLLSILSSDLIQDEQVNHIIHINIHYLIDIPFSSRVFE